MGSQDELTYGKTPISLLQELCNKREVTPQYDLVANEGAIHEPLFVFKVSAGDIVAIGKGQSKKKAKHNAAVAALQTMGASSKEITKVDFKIHEEDALGNPVGDLQEATQKRNWPPPIYEYSEGDGPPHARDFICTIKLFQYAEQATGKSKKSAKRSAAGAMLIRIRQGTIAPSDDYQPKRRYDYDQNNEDILVETNGCPDQIDLSNGSPKPAQPTNLKKSVTAERKKVTPMLQVWSKAKLSRLIEQLHRLEIDQLINLYDIHIKNNINKSKIEEKPVKLNEMNCDRCNGKIDENFDKEWRENKTKYERNNLENLGTHDENIWNNLLTEENLCKENGVTLNHNCLINESREVKNGDIDFGDWVFPDWEFVSEKVESHIYAEKFLKRLSLDENFLFDIIFSETKSPDGLEMCLVRLDTMPVLVGCGMGATKEEAKYRSFFDILTHLQILTQKSVLS